MGGRHARSTSSCGLTRTSVEGRWSRSCDALDQEAGGSVHRVKREALAARSRATRRSTRGRAR